MRLGCALVLLSLAACGRGEDQLFVYFGDELIEAPARTISIRAFTAPDGCDGVLSHHHDQIGPDEELLFETTTSYPLNPDLPILAEAPIGENFALDIAALDSGLLQIARTCTDVRLSPSDGELIQVELKALPLCSRRATSLDIMLVLDTSLQMLVLDSELTHLEALKAGILDPNSLPVHTTFGIVTFAHSGQVVEVLEQTEDLMQVATAIDDLKSLYEGEILLYDGITKAAALLRARTLCGRLPAMLVVASNGDFGSENKFEDAGIGIFAARGDDKDNVYTFAVALSEPAYDELNSLIPKDDKVGFVTGTSPSMSARAFRDARDAFNLVLADQE